MVVEEEEKKRDREHTFRLPKARSIFRSPVVKPPIRIH